MKANFADITIVLDSSSSMAGQREETLTILRKFVKDQADVPGEANLTLFQFSDGLPELIFSKPIKSVLASDFDQYYPNGYTALLDAMATVIDKTGNRLADMPEAIRPDRVCVVFVTDGEENRSRFFTKAQVDTRIAHQKQKYNWDFMYFGADQDAIAVGSSYGIDMANSLTFSKSKAGLNNTGDVFSNKMRSYRTSNYAVKSDALSFDGTDRALAVADDDSNK